MTPKTPLPWEPSNNVGLIRMYPEDYNFAVHAVNCHEKYKTIIAEFIDKSRSDIDALKLEVASLKQKNEGLIGAIKDLRSKRTLLNYEP